jgi:hypothetical protein
MFGWNGVSSLGRRVRLLLDAYGLDRRDGFIDEVIVRMHVNRDVMLRKAAEGVEGYVALVQQGHVEGMNAAIGFLAEQRDVLQAQLD